jgi:hypothetical protein
MLRCLLVLLAATLAIGGVSADAQPARDTTLEMRGVTVKDQSQLRGLYGDAWSAEEVSERAAQVCSDAGMQMVYFQLGNSDSRGRTEFAVVCR